MHNVLRPFSTTPRSAGAELSAHLGSFQVEGTPLVGIDALRAERGPTGTLRSLETCEGLRPSILNIVAPSFSESPGVF